MTRQESFEKAYAESHDLPIETFSQYRMGDTYRMPGIASHWRTWCAALDSVVIELPTSRYDWRAEEIGVFRDDIDGELLDIFEVRESIESAGLKVSG